MGRAERKDRERRQKEGEILDAAMGLFIGMGYDAMTMDEVAKAADFTKRTVYAYFSGKEDLYAALVARSLGALNDVFEEVAAATAGNGLSKIEAIGRAFIAFSASHTQDARVLSRSNADIITRPENDAHMARLAQEFRREMRVMGDAIGQGIADGSIRPDIDPMQTALYLAGFSTDLLKTASGSGAEMLRNYGISPETFLENGMAFFRHALENPSYR